jgi:5-methylcytosine-specific restriction endonuclease McrA
MPATRSDAKSAGKKQYFTGHPCKNKHVAARRTDNGTCVECVRALVSVKSLYDKARYAANSEHIRVRASLNHKINRQRRAELGKRWAVKNPLARRAISIAYKARRRQQEGGGDSTAKIFAWERAAQKVCYWCNCKCPKNYHIDHYKPLSKGGKHEVANLVVACPRCNLIKSAKDPYEFAQSVGRLF